VDRVAIIRLLAGAAQTKLEGRIVPVVRARAPGISQLGSMDGKVRRWAELTGVEPACVLACLNALSEAGPAEIAERLLRSELTSDVVRAPAPMVECAAELG
jgi:exonuclease SbcD